METTQEKERQWLRDLRKERGLTCRDLAKEVGVHYAYISDLETGRRDPSGKLAFKLATMLNFNMEQFFQ